MNVIVYIDTNGVFVSNSGPFFCLCMHAFKV